MTNVEFTTLLRQSRNGEVLAWNRLIAELRDELAQSARPVMASCRGKFEADDLIQEAFLIATRDLDQFRGTSLVEFSVWLKRIFASRVSHAVRQFVSTQSRSVVREVAIATPEDSTSLKPGVEPADPGTSPSMRAANGEERDRLDRALSQLPEEYRQVLIWREWEYCSFAEIATRMNRTENAVRKLWTRALVALELLLTRNESTTH